jgi:mannose-6-phosphate isomerase-like protein (cupin superfamily)
VRTVEHPGEIYQSVKQDKPWGYELLFADGRAGYVGKILFVKAGRSLSLQYHQHKTETITVQSGGVLLHAGLSEDALERRVLAAGDTVHLPAGTLHQVTAMTDALLVEASTAGPGWADDVVRLKDSYGRAGTSSP